MLGDDIDAKIDFEVQASADQQASRSKNVSNALENNVTTFVRRNAQEIITLFSGYQNNWLLTSLSQCFGTRTKKKQIDTQQAIAYTLQNIHKADASCFNTYTAQIKQWLFDLQQYAQIIQDFNIKCSILQFSNDINLYMRSAFAAENAHEKNPVSHFTYNVFVEFLTDDRVEIDIPQFSKLYQISVINYHHFIKAMLTQCREEQYVYPLTRKKINELTSVLFVKSCLSIEEEPSEPHPISTLTPNVRSTSMFTKEQINDFCRRISVAIQSLKTPAETVFPATEWNRKIGVLKSNLAELQTTMANLISRPPADPKALTAAITQANKTLETQVFNVWLKIAQQRGLTDSSYTAMFALVDEWKQGMSDQYWTLNGELLEMTARCERAEARVAELTNQIATAAETRGRYIEKSRQMVRLDKQVTQVLEREAMVKAECRVFGRSIACILGDTQLTDSEKVSKLKAFTSGQTPESHQNATQSILQGKKGGRQKEESEDEFSEPDMDCSSSPPPRTFTPKYQAAPQPRDLNAANSSSTTTIHATRVT